ncbi:aldo/keto reductase [Candidatus Ruminimicrobiellum ovillum]|uniref:aldo/keto reductase n=1 Tax=Candidatus Ruminimicrobiellum ovillum TaxID=1947927 RepID=UPI00355AB232
MENLKLSNGVEMPLEGFGVFQVPDPNECKNAVLEAIKAGYRLIDTAAIYMNEKAVGEAIKQAISEGIVKREDLFITTKLWVSDFSYEGAKRGFDRSLKNLGLEYLDLYLLHQVYGDVYGAWRAIEEFYNEKKIRAIGVSNFNIGKFTEFAELVNIKPMVNQIELHPFFAQYNAIENMKKYGCQPQAWGPLAEGKYGIFTHPVLTEIGKKHGKTAAQVALKWNVQRGVSILPKSVHKERIEQNFDIWNFTISDEDMKKIDALDLKHSEIIDHNNPEVVKYILSAKI